MLAARARLHRFVQPKSKRKDCEAPQFVRDHWAAGNKQQMATLLKECNFDKVS